MGDMQATIEPSGMPPSSDNRLYPLVLSFAEAAYLTDMMRACLPPPGFYETLWANRELLTRLYLALGEMRRVAKKDDERLKAQVSTVPITEADLWVLREFDTAGVLYMSEFVGLSLKLKFVEAISFFDCIPVVEDALQDAGLREGVEPTRSDWEARLHLWTSEQEPRKERPDANQDGHPHPDADDSGAHP